MITIFPGVIGGLGRVLMAVGALVLAFAAFQYWGTGLAEARAQEQLDGRFSAQLATVSNQVPEAEIETTEPSDRGDGAEPRADGPAAPILDPADIPEIGDPAGRIVIPVIGVDKTFVQGIGRDELRKGPGHFPLSALPGQPGNAAIAGHRTTYGAPFFDLDKLVPGDEIIVETLQGRFTYLVNGHDDPNDGADLLGHFIVEPTATWVLDDQGDSRLTLTACHPKRSAARRIVVTATLESTPEPTTPAPAEFVEPESEDLEDAGGEVTPEPASPEDATANDAARPDGSPNELLNESLGWQREHWPATALWAGLTALLGLAGWVLGRRWRRPAAYALIAAPFLGCLFGCFVHLDKLLPAI